MGTVLLAGTLPALAGDRPGAELANLYSFAGGSNGGVPYAGLVEGRDGRFYGTTSGDDTGGEGTVFRISPGGALTNLHSFSTFSGDLDGARPVAGLVEGPDGFFYGTTYYSRAGLGDGTVFKINTEGTLTILHEFNPHTNMNDGALPAAGLALGRDGLLYGTTFFGGTNLTGTVFKISTAGALTILHEFSILSTNGNDDGAEPVAGLVQGRDGYFYGTTAYGGSNRAGTVFKISGDGTLTTLYSFGTLTNDGGYPYAGLVQGRDGYFYGTTSYGDSSFDGFGTVFRISCDGALTTLYSFTGGDDGGYPSGTLLECADEGFLGTCQAGGTNNHGTVFKISPEGKLATLYSFGSVTNGGANPYAGLTQCGDGYFYGTTLHGGETNAGTVFRLFYDRHPERPERRPDEFILEDRDHFLRGLRSPDRVAGPFH